MSYELLTADEEEADIIANGLIDQAEILEQSAQRVLSSEKTIDIFAVISAIGLVALESIPQTSPDRKHELILLTGALAMWGIAEQFRWRILYRKANHKRQLAHEQLAQAGLIDYY